MDVDKYKLSPELKANAEQGVCPHCGKPMIHINPPHFPQKADFYCEPCHYTYPIGDYRDR